MTALNLTNHYQEDGCVVYQVGKEMLNDQQIQERLGNLRSGWNKQITSTELIAWATNVLTLARQILGGNHFQVRLLEDSIKSYSGAVGGTRDAKFETLLHDTRGILLALIADYEGGYLEDLRLKIRAEVESDFLAQAFRLIEEDHAKAPAAMLIGAVLEDALRQLCRKHEISEGKSIEAMNIPLRQKDVYTIVQQQQVTAWATIRNKAAHGHFEEFSLEEVRLMYQGVADFISRYFV
jgi:hypothetical protein